VEVTKPSEPSVQRVAPGDLATRQAVTRVNAEQASKRSSREPSPLRRVKADIVQRSERPGAGRSRRGSGDGMSGQISGATRETPLGGPSTDQPEAREGQAGPGGVADGSVVPSRPGNAGGGKGPWLKAAHHVARDRRLARSLATPQRVQELQQALHDKALVEGEIVMPSPRAGCGKSCAAERAAEFLTQSGETRREVSGPSGSPEGESRRGKEHAREAGVTRRRLRCRPARPA
jgi:hypothetical protein